MCQYDKIAEMYDSLFTDEESLTENREVGDMISLRSEETVYDIGCGTGLFVEITGIEPRLYFGYDVSKGMLKRFVEKFPEYREVLTIGNSGEMPHRKADLMVSLFGSPSYLTEKELRTIASCASRLFLMFYKEDYYPITYRKCGVDFKHFHYTEKELGDIFGQENVSEYHNYIIK